MTDITVHHPKFSEINNGYTLFSGESLSYDISVEGDLIIDTWETSTHYGSATFARGTWTYVFLSEEKVNANAT